MRVVATSDFHGALFAVGEKIPKCDLLLIAGDVCPVDGDHSWYTQRRWMLDHFFPWMRLIKEKAKEIVWIAGNHDFICDHAEMRRMLEEGKVEGIYLQDSMTEVDGVRIYGTPWVPNLEGWAFCASDRGFEIMTDSWPQCDILMMHGPPKGVLDSVPGYGGVGAPYVASAIAYKVQPKHVLFGHIHEAYGHTKIGEVEFHNVSFMDEMYRGINEPHVFDI